MLLNLSDVLASEGKVFKTSVECNIGNYHYGAETFEILNLEPITLLLSNRGKGKASIEGDLSITLSIGCNRCLKDVAYKMVVSFDRLVVSPDQLKDMEETNEDQWFVKGYQLHVEDLVYNEIMMNWPAKVLCIDDCKGICNICGKDLNVADCGCDTFVPDPRMASIKDIFNANKEV